MPGCVPQENQDKAQTDRQAELVPSEPPAMPSRGAAGDILGSGPDHLQGAPLSAEGAAGGGLRLRLG